MADGVVHVLPEGIGQEQYDGVNQKLNAQGDMPGGLRFHAAGMGEDGRWRIIEVWDSRDQFDQFNQERLTPAIAEVSGMPAEQMPEADHTWFSVHTRFPEQRVVELGEPASYLTLAPGTEVYSSDGRRVGKVAHVLADSDLDVFDGFVIDTSVLPGGHRFCDATQVDEIYERGVVITLDAAAAEGLPEPSANPGEVAVGPDDMVPDELHDKLRRAWDRISGRG